MDFVVVFFRDILDGPLYIAIVIINSLLICSCIGYIADNYLKRKKAKEAYNNTYVSVDSNAGISVATESITTQATSQVQASSEGQAPQVAQQTNQVK